MKEQFVPITPYVGQPVRFYPGAGCNIYAAGEAFLAATVAKVWDPERVNLAVFDASGAVQSMTSVRYLQDEPEVNPELAVPLPRRSFAMPVVTILGVELVASPPVDTPAPAEPAPPRVTPEHIDRLMETIQVRCHHFPGTTSTVATASLPDGFVLGVGHSACISPAMFDTEMGIKLATADALKKARDKAWELEGYLLRQRLLEAA